MAIDRLDRHASTWCHTYLTADAPAEGLFRIQWQFPAFIYECTANSLRFAPLLLAFVAETRGNPAYRDIPLGDGVYRYMAEKVLDLSRFFLDTQVLFQKLGEGDDSYLVKIEHAGGAWLRFRLSGEQTDAFLEGIAEIAEEISALNPPLPALPARET